MFNYPDSFYYPDIDQDGEFILVEEIIQPGNVPQRNKVADLEPSMTLADLGSFVHRQYRRRRQDEIEKQMYALKSRRCELEAEIAELERGLR